jgi:hypothetical protein
MEKTQTGHRAHEQRALISGWLLSLTQRKVEKERCRLVMRVDKSDSLRWKVVTVVVGVVAVSTPGKSALLVATLIEVPRIPNERSLSTPVSTSPHKRRSVTHIAIPSSTL